MTDEKSSSVPRMSEKKASFELRFPSGWREDVLGELYRGAARHNVDLELRHERGWFQDYLFFTFKGTPDNVDRFVEVVRKWIAANGSEE